MNERSPVKSNNKSIEKKENKVFDPDRRNISGAIAAGLTTLGFGNLLSIFSLDESKKREKTNNGKVSEETKTKPIEIAIEYNSEEYKKREFLESLVQMEISNEAKKIAIVIFREYQKIKNSKEFFPEEIFDEAFFMAVMQKESSYRADAVSKSKAVGVMQVKDTAIKDILRAMSIFKNKKDKKLLSLSGMPKSYKQKDIDDLLEFVKNSWDFGEILGRFYYGVLFNLYGIGRKDFERSDFAEARKKLLASYNAGPTFIRKNPDEDDWPKETRKYHKTILGWVEDIKSDFNNGLDRQDVINKFKKG